MTQYTIQKDELQKYLKDNSTTTEDGVVTFELMGVQYFSHKQLGEIIKVKSLTEMLMMPPFEQMDCQIYVKGRMQLIEDILIPFYFMDNSYDFEEPKPPVEHKTYFIANSEMTIVKIGRSVDPMGRLKTLQTTSSTLLELIKVIDGNIERFLHKKFSHLKLHGEWFSFTDEIKDFLKT